MRKIFILLFIILTACQSQQKKFDQTKWKNSCVDGFCNDRESMVADLMKNYLKVGMTKDEILGLLGNPNFTENDYNLIGYDVFIEYRGIDPSETKTLQFTFNDSVVKNFKLKHCEEN